MRRLVPPHLEGWQPVATDADSAGEEHHLLADGAVLLLDAEGSTALSVRLRAQGTLGAEPLHILLDQIFARVVDTVVAFGGYIGHFTGDGVIAAFPAVPAVAVGNAIGAATAILEHLGHLSGVVTPAGPVDLAVRAVVGAGTIDTFLWRARSINSIDQQNATYVIVGSALAEAQVGELLVDGGALGVGSAAAATLACGPYVQWSEATGGVYRAVGYVNVDLAPRSISETARPVDSTPATPSPASTAPAQRSAGWRFVIPEAFDEAVQPEFRLASVLFLELREWPHEDTVAVIIEQAASSGGHISNVLRTSAEQQGITFMLVWGAPTGHADDASRALAFVEAVQHEIGADGFKTGAVYSNMFVGFVGSDSQSTYTVIGAPVNLAARLCNLADWGEIRVTEVFDDMVTSHWTIESVAPTLYRGFSTPLATRSLRPGGGASPSRRTWPRRQRTPLPSPPPVAHDEDPDTSAGDPQPELIADAVAELQTRAAGHEPPE